MASITQSSLSLSFSPNERDFGNLIKWVESIPVSHLPQDYSALAVLIQQEIEPIIREKAPQIVKGKVLPSEIAQSKGFANQLGILSSKALDLALLPFLNSNTALESVLVSRTVEKVNTISKVIFFIYRTDKDKSALGLMCQGAIQKLVRMQDSIEGPFNVFAQALTSNESPCFLHLTNSSEQSSFEITQDLIQGIEGNFGQSEFTLEPGKGMLLEKHFDHGKIERTNTQLSVVLKDDKVITTQTKNTTFSSFTDLRFKSEVSFSL